MSEKDLEMTDENFVRGFMRLCEGTEIPPTFALWCAISGISAVLGRRVWVDIGVGSLFPNMYVLLVAGSGKCRKSTSIKQIENLVRLLDPKPNIIAQKITPEALIETLRQFETSENKSQYREICEGWVCADELATFLNRDSYECGLAALMIPLYDCKDNFEYKTKSRGSEKIENACLGMLSGSTVDWIQKGIPEEAVGGGLTSRMLFVYVDKPAPPVPFPEFSEDKRKLLEVLVRQLQALSSAKGQVRLSDGAKAAFSREYMKFRETSPLNEDKTLSGYASRRGDHLLKLGMIFSVAESNEMIIEEKHIIGSINLLRELELHLPMVMSLITQSEEGSLLSLIRSMIGKKATGISRTDLLRAVSHKVDSRELSNIIDTLVQSGEITTKSDGSQIMYLPVK